jgi:DNA-binding transcriptional regulator YdaS (Cro superfamily)
MPKNDSVPISKILSDRFAAQSPGAQAAFAAKVGVSPAAVSRWASKESIPQEWRADKIAAALEMSVDQVMDAIVLERRLRPRPKSASERGDEAQKKTQEQIAELRAAIKRIEAVLDAALRRRPK